MSIESQGDIKADAQEPTSPPDENQSETSQSSDTDTSQVSDIDNRKVPYSRLSEVIEQRNQERQAREQREAELQQLYAKVDELLKPKEQPKGDKKFKDNYERVDELYQDIRQAIVNDPDFLNNLIDAMSSSGDKADNFVYESLLRKQRAVAAEQDRLYKQDVARNKTILAEIENEFAGDTDNYNKFIEFAKAAIAKGSKAGLDDLYVIYRENLYRPPQVPEAAKKIARSPRASGGKVSNIDVRNKSYEEIIQETMGV